MLTDGGSDKLARRVGSLLANDAQFAAASPDKAICEAIMQPGLGWADLMRVVATGYAERPALGQRATEVVTIGGRGVLQVLPRFDIVSYRELWGRVTAVARALAGIGVRPGDRIATLGFCSVDYTTIDMAVPLLAAVSVPLHAGAPAAQLRSMVQEAQPTVIACSAEYLEVGVELASSGRPALIVVFDYHPEVDDHRDALNDAGRRLAGPGRAVVVETLTQLIKRGSALPMLPTPPADGDRLAVIVYTSGSSGRPKGAMQPESLAQSVWMVTAGNLLQHGFALPTITLNYMPMSHTAGRAMLYSTLGAGGTAYFAGKSDLSTVLDDLALVRPTQLNFVPRVWEMLYREFLNERQRRGPAVSDEEVLAELRVRLLGDRFISALSGSAPISEELAKWAERLLDAHLMNAFGATETGSVLVDGRVQRPPVTDYKLIDVPELGYFGTDKPHPRGELLIKSRTLFAGYYQRPELTAEAFDENGYFRTGDVVAEIGPDQLRYVDRRNNVLKLSQGEFVAVSKLEAIYVTCDLVHQIYVYGNGERSYLLAVVVPTEEAMVRFSGGELKRLILKSMQEAARAAELEPYEIPRDIVIEPSPFTLDNGLLSGIRKPSRPNLRAKYGPQLEQLYDDLAEGQRRKLEELRAGGTGRPTIHTVCAVAGSLLGTATEDPPAAAHFTDLGGDSLSALTFANTLHDIFDVDVPVGIIVSPARNLQSVADYIDTEHRRDGLRPTFASVHGSNATSLNAGDLTLDKFIGAATLDSARNLKPPASKVKTVLLTGATGYLGRYLLLYWLDRMSAVGGNVVCVVRAQNDAAAQKRLNAVFDSGDRELMSRYSKLAATHLEVLAGDKGDTNLGLDSTTWQRLADQVDLIVDPAAMVNHMLPYQQLFAPNVVGTAELLSLALTTRKKHFCFVSSVAVGAALPFGEFTEDADVRTSGATRTLDATYANGYAASKWSSEVLLREAHHWYSLPVTVFRCDMIMAETSYRGQLNVSDMVTRLILSVAATGLAPGSFYASDPGDDRPRAHFDGLSVDFVAESISTLTAEEDCTTFRTFHVVNPHDDGIGIDTFIDWMIDAGYRIERISDYDQWFARFETALRNLPERQRKASLLPLLISFRSPQAAIPGAVAPAHRFRKAVARYGIGDSGQIPKIDKSIIHKYLSDLELLGLLHADGSAAPLEQEN